MFHDQHVPDHSPKPSSALVRSAFLLLGSALALAAPAAEEGMIKVFHNETPIIIKDLCADQERPACAALPEKYGDGSLPPAVKASVYPSRITVPDDAFPEGAKISDVDVTIHGLSHDFLNDVDILLVGPRGHYVMLASNVGSAAGGGLRVKNLTWVFDDDARLPLHRENNNEGRVSNRAGTPGYKIVYDEWRDIWIDQNPRTFKPTDYDLADYDVPDTDTDRFPKPAPGNLVTPPSVVKHPNGVVSSGPSLSFFKGSDPRGVWSLYVVDDYFWYAGKIARGWSLSITVGNACHGFAASSG
jgi:hypothetical protein